MKIGSPLELKLNSLSGRTYKGTVSRISSQADPMTGNMVVFATILNADRALRPGFSCNAHLSFTEIKDALIVPVEAIGDNAGSSVVTQIRGGKAYEVHVELGTETREYVQILQGLSAGDLVAISGGYGLPNECPVEVIASENADSDGKSKGK